MMSPLWIPSMAAFWFAWAYAPDNLSDSNGATGTTEDTNSMVDFIFALSIVFSIFHPIIAFFKFPLGLSFSKWQGLILCEVGKGSVATALLIGGISTVNSGDAAPESIFFVAVCVLVVLMFTYSIGRVISVVNVARSAEGLSGDGFDSYYFGTDPKCPITPYLFARERRRFEKEPNDISKVQVPPATFCV
jgi:hypothetical protein